MSEIPDLEGYRAYFNRRLAGQHVQRAQVTIPIVVRALREEFAAALSSNTLGAVERRGKYLIFCFASGHLLVVHPMLAGRFQYCQAGERRPAKMAFVLALEDGQELRYLDERLMGRVYLAPAEGELGAVVARWTEMGPDAMSQKLTEDVFLERLQACSGQIKNVLTREHCVAGIGNAYVDEVLWEAGVHPYRQRRELSDEALRSLYRAMRSVLAWATSIVVERMEREGLPSGEYRDHLRVHRRGGQPCPRCGTTVSEVTANQRITNFCRRCQR
jgi:formamidopyrimidine-DNA glycosylase